MIQRLNLSNFTCFAENTFDFSEGINVFIGENGTGKTHILKLLSCLLNSQREIARNGLESKDKIGSLIAQQLLDFFQPEQLGRLTRRSQGNTKSLVRFTKTQANNTQNIEFSFSTRSESAVVLSEFTKSATTEEFNFVYFPPREMLSIFEGFLSLYNRRETPFDATYYHLANSLGMPLSKGARNLSIRELLEPLEEAIQAKVVSKNNRFYLQFTDGALIEATLVAEGLRKIGTLMYLIANGELTQNSYLFWDEPEANLNPKLVELIAHVLCRLANKGVQIFIASHDYLLVNYLSVFYENRAFFEKRNHPIPSIKFFAFSKEEHTSPSHIHTANSILELDTSILKEFTKFYDKAQQWSYENTLTTK